MRFASAHESAEAAKSGAWGRRAQVSPTIPESRGVPRSGGAASQQLSSYSSGKASRKYELFFSRGSSVNEDKLDRRDAHRSSTRRCRTFPERAVPEESQKRKPEGLAKWLPDSLRQRTRFTVLNLAHAHLG